MIQQESVLNKLITRCESFMYPGAWRFKASVRQCGDITSPVKRMFPGGVVRKGDVVSAVIVRRSASGGRTVLILGLTITLQVIIPKRAKAHGFSVL